MPRRLLAINVVLAAVCVLCVALIVKQLVSARPSAQTRTRPPAAAPAGPSPTGDTKLPAQAYSVIAARNLFSPTRSESTGPATPGGAAQALIAKPNLHGVVLREGSPIAYMEDPLTKRIAGYRVGDPIAGGTVQTISADAVVISRPDGMVDVRLRDPSKPRPAAPQAAPGQPQVPGQQPVPGQLPAGGQLPNQGLVPVPGPVPGQPPQRAFTPPVPGQPMSPPGVQQPVPGGPATPIPFGRPAPSLGRRVPPIPQDPSGQPLPAPSQ